MGRSRLLAITVGILLAAFCAGNAVDGTRINGRAVSVQWIYSQTGWGDSYCISNGSWVGSIDLFTITSGKVTRTDTLFSRSKGYCYCAAFNLCGNKVAFYRLAKAPGSGGACTSVNGGANTISIINIDGTGLTNLCDAGNQPLMYNGGAANAGKYEDASGAWHSVPGWSGSCPVTQVADPAAFEDAPRALTASVDRAGSIRISPSRPGHGTVRIIGLQGRTVYTAALAGPIMVPAGTLKPGVYLVREGSVRQAVSTKITVSY
jgi:hypothetical protein